MKVRMAILLIVSGMLLPAVDKPLQRAETAAEVLDQIMASPDRSIPADLLNRAHCVAIVPGVLKGGFIVGGKYGKGFISCRGGEGKGWTGPSAVKIEGGSFGLQIGGVQTDVVLLMMNERGKKKLLQSKFTLGADAVVAGGPVGRTAQAQTDAQLHAEILSYSRSRGVFAGVSLEGATLRPDRDVNRKIYGGDFSPKQILFGEIPPPQSVTELMAALNKHSSSEHR